MCRTADEFADTGLAENGSRNRQLANSPTHQILQSLGTATPVVE
jgi:hypothetical protein